ncbi:MAG: DUF1810 family protein [Legionella sp.]|nr:DUF1810 family protein [Legionella sp.]
MPNLNRFISAQQGHASFPSYEKAYKEIEKGRKQDHWIWYIFPQLKTLGYSDTAKHFGIADFKEACEYLQNETLFKNYCAITQLVMSQLDTIPINTLMGGGIDASKLASSITLFRAAASFLAQQNTASNDYAEVVSCCDQILTKIKPQGYYPCQKTITIIAPVIDLK